MKSKKFDIDEYLASAKNTKPIVYPSPIKYTVENKDGVYEYSDSFDINRTTSLIRIQTLYPIKNTFEDNPMYLIKRFFVNDTEVMVKYFVGTGGEFVVILDIPLEKFLNSTNDLKFELIENSKIEVILFLKRHENIEP